MLYFRAEMMTVFRNASPMLSDDMSGSSATVMMHEASSVRIERAHFLRNPGALRLLHHELGHLAQLGVLALAVIEAIDDERAIVFRGAAGTRC